MVRRHSGAVGRPSRRRPESHGRDVTLVVSYADGEVTPEQEAAAEDELFRLMADLILDAEKNRARSTPAETPVADASPRPRARRSRGAGS